MDNYCTHTRNRVHEKLQELGGKVELHFLPPYSPDENDIERVRWDVHENVTRNHRRQTVEQLITDVYEYTDQYVEEGSRQAGHQKVA